MKSRFSKFVVYGSLSLICSSATLIGIFLLWLQGVSNANTESGLFDIPIAILLLLYVFPLVHAIGFLLGLISFWQQPKALGIGLWAMIASLLLFLFDIFVWFRWTNRSQ